MVSDLFVSDLFFTPSPAYVVLLCFLLFRGMNRGRLDLGQFGAVFCALRRAAPLFDGRSRFVTIDL
jgi:hypothetical protein